MGLMGKLFLKMLGKLLEHMIKRLFISGLLVLVLNSNAFSQNVQVVNQYNEHSFNEIRVVVKVDQSRLLVLPIDKDGMFTLPKDVKYQIDIIIEGSLLQPYFNQFSKEDLSFLDSIQVFEKFKLSTKTPRFFFSDIYSKNIDSIIKNDWLKSRLENTEMKVKLIVYNTFRLTCKDKRKIKIFYNEYRKSLGLNREELELEYKDLPYVATDEDLFNSGTIITKDFIMKQNTNLMHDKAKNYGIALVVNIIRN